MDLNAIKRSLKSKMLNLPHIAAKRKKYLESMRAEYDYSLPTPSIICTACIGGMISNNLGLRFMSPTVNLWMMPQDIVKFLTDMDTYLNADFVEDKTTQYTYPVGRLKDITVYFNHYPDFDAAVSKWNDRKQRIDRENMYIITDDKFLTDEDIAALESVKCKRLIIFTKDEERDSHFFKLKAYEGMSEVGNYSVRDFSGFSTFEKEFNYSAWLSGKDNIRM
ncbi:MAG: DUF1919 domain-containing protein [Firmicutes bacterium]|nr:DUF1919 domain-containing protein [Bacillota bacterium]